MKKSGLFALLILTISWASFGQNSDKFKKEGKNSQTIIVNQTISETTEIFPFGQNGDNIYGLDVTADIELNSDNSLVRLILTDNNFNEYLIYESYNLLLEEGSSFSVKDICEETGILDGVLPYSIQIKIENAQLKLKSISYSTSVDNSLDLESLKKEKKKGQNEVKINKLNKNLKKKGKHWVAGETNVSELSYGERKKLYGQSTIPAGFEYYTGGVILAGSTESSSTDDETLKSATTTTESPYVGEWDWRDRHGKDWVSPVTYQEYCGSCWAFAATGATEALVNLYFNKQLNLDLSEQDLLSCSGGGSCDGGYPYIALDYISSTGIVDEATFPYSATDEACTNKGSNPNELIQIGGKVSFGTTECPATEDNLKKLLINYGPVSGGLYDWLHAMTLVGYKTVEEGDQFFYRDLNLERYWITIEAGDPLIGKTVWIFKNSWGKDFGDLGYVYVETDITNIGWTHALQTPVTSQVKNYNVTCEDADGDGYYWWGLGEKPANCPECPDLADGDDSDPTKGPLDEYGYCITLDGSTIPVAMFSADNNEITTGETITFDDNSLNNPTSWNWIFEGGNPATSTEENPSVLYSTAGNYKVSLTATNSDGSDTKVVEGYIEVNDPAVKPVAYFSANPTSVSTGGTVTFTDLSSNTPTSWSWSFQGGSPSTSTEQNPQVTYSTAGSYIVALTVTNDAGSNTKLIRDYIVVSGQTATPVANFSASETSINTDETVTFTDLSANTPTSWSWTFEGGTPATSTAQNPTVTYTTAGTYKVTLMATNAGGSDTKTVYNYIEVTEPVVAPVAGFSASPRSLTEGETVSFTDLSSNEPTSWEWTFEGGVPATSTEQNPTVSYYTANTYSVTLTVTNEGGSNTQVMENYIEVTEPVVLPVADFSANNTSVTTDETVSFTDLSSDASSWSWTFEGGTPATSILQNPSVSYATAGNYKVTLVATNNDGSDTKSVDNYIQVNEAGVAPAADFSADNTSITTGETVTFSDLSTNEPTSWSWIFDGGTPGTSTQQNPTVTYNSAGTYKVTLTATNDFGSDIKTVDSYIEVNDPLVLPVADFSADNTSLTTEETVTFTDLTSNDPVAWNWTFEGGNPATSTQQNPTVTYSSAGTYNVTLTATNADGTDSKTVYNYIEVTEQVIAPVAEFSANVTTITEGETVTFNDLSSNEPTSWSWTFEGGTPSTSTAKNPSVTYATAGTYSVTLVVSNEGGSDTKTVESYIKVEEYVPSYCIPTTDASIEWIAGVDIDGQSNTSGSNGYTDFSSIVFELVSGDNQTIVLSPGFSSRSKFEYWAVWIDFDKDMTFSDSEKVLSSKKSKSEITESISIPGGLNITTRMRVALSPTVPSACSDLIGEVEDYTVHIYEPAPVADFTASSTNVTVGESVQFTNTSLYNPTSLVWNFEGLTASASSVEDPVVSYDTPGEYLVTLTASNDLGTSQKSMKITVFDQGDNTIVDYCTPENVSSSLNYIRRVVFAGYDIESGADGYGLSTSTMDNIEAGQNYVAELYPYSNTTRNYWKVWIDYNNDGDFDDSGEMALEINNKKGMVTGNITVPSDVIGTTRMRIAMKVGSAPLTPCDDNFVGEVEDYNISFEPPLMRASASDPSAESGLGQNTITVYPNPTANYINISIDEISFDDAYSIYDVSGKKVIQGQIISSSTRVDLTEYPSGIYLVKVLNYNQTTIKKIIKKD